MSAPGAAGGGCATGASRNQAALQAKDQPRAGQTSGDVCLIPIGKDENDLRFHFKLDGRHAGGITVHSARDDCFSYGIAVAEDMRRQGAASAALSLLFERMRARGYARVSVRVEAENAASLALHDKLGFVRVARQDGVAFLEKAL